MKKFKSRKYKKFTLVELLVVMAIMALLLYVSMPAFEKLLKGYGVDAAASQMTGALKLARDNAITNKQYTALLLPHRLKPGTGSGGLPAEYIHRSYRLCAVNRTGTSTYEFLYWLPGSKWEFLPTGTAILEYDDEYHAGPNGQDDINNLSSHEIVNGVDCSDIGAGTVNNVLAAIFKPTGEIPSVQRYLSLGEATFNGTSLIFTNDRPKYHEQGVILLLVDGYTGRVTYGPRSD